MVRLLSKNHVFLLLFLSIIATTCCIPKFPFQTFKSDNYNVQSYNEKEGTYVPYISNAKFKSDFENQKIRVDGQFKDQNNSTFFMTQIILAKEQLAYQIYKRMAVNKGKQEATATKEDQEPIYCVKMSLSGNLFLDSPFEKAAFDHASVSESQFVEIWNNVSIKLFAPPSFYYKQEYHVDMFTQVPVKVITPGYSIVTFGALERVDAFNQDLFTVPSSFEKGCTSWPLMREFELMTKLHLHDE